MFERLCHTYTLDSIYRLYNSTVCICGLGGGGGIVAEILARTGVGNFVLVDGDTFEDSNKNRQLGALDSTLGKSKVEVIAKRIKDIHNRVTIQTYNVFINKENYVEILCNLQNERFINVVCDTVDGTKNKVQLADFCKVLNIPYVTGGCGGYKGWTSTVLDPKKYSTRQILNVGNIGVDTIDVPMSPSPNPAEVFIQGALQAQEIINLLLQRDWNVKGKEIHFNHMTYTTSVIETEK